MIKTKRNLSVRSFNPEGWSPIKNEFRLSVRAWTADRHPLPYSLPKRARSTKCYPFQVSVWKRVEPGATSPTVTQWLITLQKTWSLSVSTILSQIKKRGSILSKLAVHRQLCQNVLLDELVVVVVAFSSRARILGERSTIHFPPALFFFSSED